MNAPARLKTLLSVPNEWEAAAVVGALAEEGVPAKAVGAATAGFRAEAPGEVAVLVAEEDVPRAQAILASVDLQATEVDWSQVDVGQPEETAGNKPNGAERVAASGRPLQFRLGTLFLVQTCLAVCLSIWKGPSVLTLVAVLVTVFLLAVTGTVWIARDPQQVRDRWSLVGQWLVIGLVLVIALELAAVAVQILLAALK